MTTFILEAPQESGPSHRAIIDTDWSTDDKLEDFLGLLDSAGLPRLSTPHQVHAIAGPDHEHHDAALAAYGLVRHAPCPERIVTRTMEMLVAGETIPPEAIDDESLTAIISIAFVTEHDWEHRANTCEIAARTFLASMNDAFAADTKEYGRNRLIAYASLASALMVAVSQARAELSS